MAHYKHALLERLSHYYHCLATLALNQAPSAYFTSAELARIMRLDPSQVRKDLATVGVNGQPQLGFAVDHCAQALRQVLGLDHHVCAVLIGAGRLGSALATHRPFVDFGLEVVAIFDNDRTKYGRAIGPLVVCPMNDMAAIVDEYRVRLAILTIPGSAAQEVAEQAVAAGVETIWNFAPAGLHLSDAIFVRNEHIAVGLGEIAYQLKVHRAPAPPRPGS